MKTPESTQTVPTEASPRQAGGCWAPWPLLRSTRVLARGQARLSPRRGAGIRAVPTTARGPATRNQGTFVLEEGKPAKQSGRGTNASGPVRCPQHWARVHRSARSPPGALNPQYGAHWPLGSGEKPQGGITTSIPSGQGAPSAITLSGKVFKDVEKENTADSEVLFLVATWNP